MVIGTFFAYGTVKKKKITQKKKTATNDENALNIFAAVQLNPTISTRQLEGECELSKRSTLRILHSNKFHPYHIYLPQNLEEPWTWLDGVIVCSRA